MKTIIIDDDPTGTQCASEVLVLLEWDVDSVTEALSSVDSVYLLSNSRALNEVDAVSLAIKIRNQGIEAGKRLDQKIEFILRGDSTLRGHIFAETEVFLKPGSSIIFLPAYPEVGRTTIDGVHYVKIEGEVKRVDETEFAKDPVFSFTTSTLVDFVSEKSGRVGIHFGLKLVRGEASQLIQALSAVPEGSVILPDVENDGDIERIAHAILALQTSERPLVVRCAAPLAATLAGVRSRGFLPSPLKSGGFRTLLVAGSHTEGATRQLGEVSKRFGKAEVINTEAAFEDSKKAADSVISGAKEALENNNFSLITTERHRKIENNTLEHGSKVMNALITVVKKLIKYADVVVAKGGITSAEVARSGIGSKSAWVLGQILPGISVWKLESDEGREIIYVVVPGNVGDSKTLLRVLEIVGLN